MFERYTEQAPASHLLRSLRGQPTYQGADIGLRSRVATHWRMILKLANGLIAIWLRLLLHRAHLIAMQTAFSLPEAIALLSRTPPTLNTFLRGLPSRWVAENEGPDSWSAFDIVGHLIIGERTDWMPRAKRILEHGEAIPFDPFDRFAQEKECRGKSLEELLDEFTMLRAQNLAALETLQLRPADLAKTGTHQRLGTVTLAQLFATWAAHDLTHLHQLSRVMAHQYRDAVGPWTAFLGVMRCAGHSAP
jgi:hypothetical protein